MAAPRARRREPSAISHGQPACRLQRRLRTQAAALYTSAPDDEGADAVTHEERRPDGAIQTIRIELKVTASQ
jgi:hypothetical protein